MAPGCATLIQAFTVKIEIAKLNLKMYCLGISGVHLSRESEALMCNFVCKLQVSASYAMPVGTGVLLNKKWVLTARHNIDMDWRGQVIDIPADELSDCYSSETLNVNVSIDNSVGELIEHKTKCQVFFAGNKGVNFDVALLLLEEPLQYDVELPKLSLIQDLASVLSKRKIHAIGFCRRNRGQSMHRVNVLCPETDAGYVVKVQTEGGLPSGYSGGPLIMKYGDADYVIGLNCLGGDASAVGASIAFHPLSRWITNIMGKFGANQRFFRICLDPEKKTKKSSISKKHVEIGTYVGSVNGDFVINNNNN